METHDIDWLDLGDVPTLDEATGRLGMIGLDGAAGLARADDVDTLVLLVEDRELASSGQAGIVAALAAEAVRVIRYPVADMGVPGDVVAFRAVLDGVRDEIRDGRYVVVACLAGYGRTGTAVACLLVDAGLNAKEAIAQVRAARPGTIENQAQEAFIRDWAAPSSSTTGTERAREERLAALLLSGAAVAVLGFALGGMAWLTSPTIWLAMLAVVLVLSMGGRLRKAR